MSCSSSHIIHSGFWIVVTYSWHNFDHSHHFVGVQYEIPSVVQLPPPLSISRTLQFWCQFASLSLESLRWLPGLLVAGVCSRAMADIRASVVVWFGVFIFVECFIVFLWAWNCRNLRNLPLDSASCWSKQKIIDLTSGCREITGCPSVCSPFGISANMGFSHWSLLA